MILDWLQDLDPKRDNLDPQSREILTRLLNEIEAIYKENQELKADSFFFFGNSKPSKQLQACLLIMYPNCDLLQVFARKLARSGLSQ